MTSTNQSDCARCSFFFYRSCSNKFFYSQTVLSLTITCTASNNNVYCTILFGVSLYLFRLFSPLIFRTWNRALSTNMSHWLETTKHLDPVVWKVDKAIHWINLYPVDNVLLISLIHVLTGIHCIAIYLAPVVQKVDNTIHRINLYPLDSAIGFPNTCTYRYPLYSNLSGPSCSKGG